MRIKEPVLKFIKERFLSEDDEEILTDNVQFLDQGIIDSTGVLELIMFIEEHFKITINDDELIPENFNDLNSIEKFILEKQKL